MMIHRPDTIELPKKFNVLKGIEFDFSNLFNMHTINGIKTFVSLVIQFVSVLLLNLLLNEF